MRVLLKDDENLICVEVSRVSTKIVDSEKCLEIAVNGQKLLISIEESYWKAEDFIKEAYEIGNLNLSRYKIIRGI